MGDKGDSIKILYVENFPAMCHIARIPEKPFKIAFSKGLEKAPSAVSSTSKVKLTKPKTVRLYHAIQLVQTQDNSKETAILPSLSLSRQ